jgi:hypothetical protein
LDLLLQLINQLETDISSLSFYQYFIHGGFGLFQIDPLDGALFVPWNAVSCMDHSGRTET